MCDNRNRPWLRLVLEVGLEPTQPQWPKDFKSFVSTIPPFERPIVTAKVTFFFKLTKSGVKFGGFWNIFSKKKPPYDRRLSWSASGWA